MVSGEWSMVNDERCMAKVPQNIAFFPSNLKITKYVKVPVVLVVLVVIILPPSPPPPSPPAPLPHLPPPPHFYSAAPLSPLACDIVWVIVMMLVVVVDIQS